MAQCESIVFDPLERGSRKRSGRESTRVSRSTTLPSPTMRHTSMTLAPAGECGQPQGLCPLEREEFTVVNTIPHTDNPTNNGGGCTALAPAGAPSGEGRLAGSLLSNSGQGHTKGLCN